MMNLIKVLIKKLIYKFSVKYLYFCSYLSYCKLKKSQKHFFNRIKLIYNSSSINNYKKICIFVAYTNRLSISTKLYIKALVGLNYGVVFVNNIPISNEDLEFLYRNSILAFNRINLGQDMGAYKDIFLYLSSENYLANIDFLCFANDSVQFIPGKYQSNFHDAVLKFESSGSDGLFSHHSNEVKPHFQSFFSIIKRNIFCKLEYINFWKNYIPLSNREHCVHKGEILLSQKFYNKINNPTVLYDKNKLLESIDLDGLEEDKSIDLSDLDILNLIPSFSRTFIQLEILKLITFLFQSNKYKKYKSIKNNFVNQNPKIGNIKKNNVGKYIFQLIEYNNPSQVAAFLYPLFLKCPFVKNNLILSGSFEIDQAFNLYKICLKKSMFLDNPEEKNIYKKLISEYNLLVINKENPKSFNENFLKGVKFGINEGFKYSFH